MDLTNFINLLQEKLGLENVVVQEVDSLPFGEEKALACSSIKEDVVFYKKGTKEVLDLLFALAHESRHLWQKRQLFYKAELEKYKTVDEIGLVSYNHQFLEFDANAFATAFMKELTGLTPLFNGLPEESRKAIYFSAKKIKIKISLKERRKALEGLEEKNKGIKEISMLISKKGEKVD